jgi:hypothetical protein
MRDKEPTIRSRELGDGLRAAMERAGLNNRRTAELLEWPEPRLSKVLHGRRGVDEVEVSAFLAVCGVKGRERARLLGLTREQDTPGWLQQFGARLPKQLQTFIDHENKATDITDFATVVLPGILQTGEYARAVIDRIANVPDKEVEERVAARLARTNVFSRPRPPQFSFLIHELVLWLPVGDNDVMCDQLHHLLRLSVRRYISIRVVPAVSGAHAGGSGSFILMESDRYKPVVYLEGETSGLFLEEKEEIDAYRNVVKDLEDLALSEENSRELIGTVAAERYASREDNDDGE